MPRTEYSLLIFDTGPLLDLVFYSCTTLLPSPSVKEDLNCLKTQDDYGRFSQFVSMFRKKLTTPGVVAEISRRIQGKKELGRHLWPIVYREMISMGLDEDLVKLLAMPQELVAGFGAVDASVLQLGLLNHSLRPCIVSVDQKLCAECRNAGLEAITLWEAIAIS